MRGAGFFRTTKALIFGRRSIDKADYSVLNHLNINSGLFIYVEVVSDYVPAKHLLVICQVDLQVRQERQARRRVLITTAPAAAADESVRELPREMSRHADAVSFILVAAECPARFRAFVDAVLGAADGDGEGWFDAADFSVGMRARAEADLSRGPDEEPTTFVKPVRKETVEKWTQRARRDFNEWQEAAGLTLVETMPGARLMAGTVPPATGSPSCGSRPKPTSRRGSTRGGRASPRGRSGGRRPRRSSASGGGYSPRRGVSDFAGLRRRRRNTGSSPRLSERP